MRLFPFSYLRRGRQFDYVPVQVFVIKKLYQWTLYFL
jgi:hypothetical protein